MDINYNIARSKAISLKSSGYGKTPAIKNYNMHILSYCHIDDLTQVVAISFYRAKKDGVNFYSVLSNEIALMGLYRNKYKEQIDFSISEKCNDRELKQLETLYSVVGFKLFYQHLNISEPKSTVQKWTWKAFGKRKNESRLSTRTKRQIEKVLLGGGRIRFSKTSTSVYIINNEVEIRISDHSEDAKQDFEKIQISYVASN